MRRTHVIGVLGGAALALGCVGSLGSEGPHRPDVEVEIERPPVCVGAAEDVRGPRLLRRLTRPELETSVRRVFGLTTEQWAGPDLPPDPADEDGLTNRADLLLVGDSYAERLRDTAEDVGDAMASGAACGGSDCVAEFVQRYARRAYRRPLEADEVARFRGLYETAGEDYPEFVRWATAALVQSPHFVYRSELGHQSEEWARLDDFETATLLAYTLTGGPPTEELLARAEVGDLADAAQRREIARELAFDPDGEARPEFRDQVQAFARTWLGLPALDNLSKSPEHFPDWTPAIRQEMRAEVESFVDRTVIADRGTVRALLTDDGRSASTSLAAYYGWSAEGSARPDGWGVGVLALGGVLAITATNHSTSPTQRGYLVRRRLMCHVVPDPPANVGDIPEPTPASTTRERYEDVHAANALCNDCHRLMDPIGFAFEHLDAAGRYRETENDLPIDATGSIESEDPTVMPVTFDGPDELTQILADDPAVSECVGSFVAAMGYGLRPHDAECLASTPLDGLSTDSLPLVELYFELMVTPHASERALGR